MPKMPSSLAFAQHRGLPGEAPANERGVPHEREPEVPDRQIERYLPQRA